MFALVFLVGYVFNFSLRLDGFDVSCLFTEPALGLSNFLLLLTVCLLIEIPHCYRQYLARALSSFLVEFITPLDLPLFSIDIRTFRITGLIHEFDNHVVCWFVADK